MLPLAIECGMPLDVFWYEDMRLFRVYSKAYANRNEQLAWLIGTRVYEAVGCIMADFASAKGAPPHKYSDKANRIESQPKAAAPATSGVATWASRIKQLKGIPKEA